MSTRDAVIVSTARTGIGRAYRGAFNATPSPTLAAHPIRAALERANVDPAEVDDVIMGAALQQGVQTTIGRTAALRAGLPVTVSGMSIDRQCASGLMSIATAAKRSEEHTSELQSLAYLVCRLLLEKKKKKTKKSYT